jgi:hypothetical protein
MDTIYTVNELGCYLCIKNICMKLVEDMKGVIRIRKSKRSRQYNGQMKNNNDLQNTTQKIKNEQHEFHWNAAVYLGVRKGSSYGRFLLWPLASDIFGELFSGGKLIRIWIYKSD